VFTNTEPRTVTYPLGILAIPNTSGSVWNQEYQNILQAQDILAVIPKTTPSFTTAQAASLTGVVQTMQALNYMMIAEAHDTLGLAILPAGLTGTTAPPAVCMKDAWLYIVALLDSALTNLNTAGATIAPTKLPTGFTGVYQSSGPSTVAGSFASFTMALAAKANLELAYAIARTPTNGASAPTPTSPGAPDPLRLDSAMTDLLASAMYNPGALGPDPVGTFKQDAFDVTFDFSAASGDLVNPVQAQIGTLAQLNDFVADVDTVNDQRWFAKFILNPNSVQQPTYNAAASKYIFGNYSLTSAPIPIIREVQMIVWHAEIELGMGNYALALADANLIRMTAGSCGGSCKVGQSPLVPYSLSDASSYQLTRNDLMKEQRVSTTWEESADRTIMIRNYGLPLVSDTTWEHEDPLVTGGDQHTTVSPIPQAELDGRGGTWTTTCN
jgi:hypothetical protein